MDEKTRGDFRELRYPIVIEKKYPTTAEVAMVNTACRDFIEFLISSYPERFKVGENEENNDELGKCHLGFQEQVINAVYHGNFDIHGEGEGVEAGKDVVERARIRWKADSSRYENKKIIIKFVMNKGGFEVAIKDEGKGFKPEEVADPLAPENIMKKFGRGSFLVEQLGYQMSVESSEDGTVVHLKRNWEFD